MKGNKFFNRELSWLSFNHRVLQEAEDPSNPLYERIKFLAIFSSNLDEFFRVRVASLRSLLSLKKKTQQELNFDPAKLLKEIHSKVNVLQDEIGHSFRKLIIPELRNHNIFLVNEKNLLDEHTEFVYEYFNELVLPHISPMLLAKKKFTPFLRNNRLYHTVKLSVKTNKKTQADDSKKRKKFIYAIVEIPSNHLPRFIELPKIEDKIYIIFLDDVIRFCLPQIFHGYDVIASYSIKLSRDAELYIQDEFSGDLLEKIKKGIKKRTTGVPCRFLFDPDMPKGLVKFLKDSLFLNKADLMPGGKYHNFKDFLNFPNPGLKELEYESFTPLRHREYDLFKDKFEAWNKQDFLFLFPYHTYNYVVEALRLAASDPEVKSIKITQYRVAKNSEIVKSLIKAVRNGKSVTAFVEIKARFDEEVNIQSAEEMQKAGVKVLYSLPGLKVHSKMALISRLENGELKNYAYLSTGNFNEITSKTYSDYGLFTSDKRLTGEIERVFDHLEGKIDAPNFEHLLVAQFNMRKTFLNLIDNEIKNAKEDKKASIIIKLNSIEDEKMIRKLYDASQEGVKISIIVRGICSLIPGIKKLSSNIRALSIVDRFLEHTRVFIFHNCGNEQIYLSSADWMRRNLSRRIEVAFPIYDENLKKEIKKVIKLQLKDNTKARMIDKNQTNEYKKPDNDDIFRSQYDIYEYLKSKN